MAIGLGAPLVALLLITASAAGEATEYRAAVAVLPGEKTSRRTLDHFEELSHSASSQGAQLIVFPEAALWDDISRKVALSDANVVASVGSTPCDARSGAQHMPQVARLSCIAREAGLVVVANVLSKIPCNQDAPHCPHDGFRVYNSDVIHDERGRVLATYFKRHDYPPLDQPPLVPVSFNTSFGVEFGVFVCYDMTFTSPAEQLVARGIRNFVFSTHWLNEFPLQTATMSQQGWSRFYGANLIASNIADKVKHAGSGIYVAGQPIAVSFNATGAWPMEDALLLADLKAVPPFSPVAVATPTVAPAVAAAATTTTPTAAVRQRETACTVKSAEDAHAGTCAILEDQPAGIGGEGRVAMLASHNTDAKSGASVHCEANITLLAGVASSYALFASAWRSASRLDVCAVLPCTLDANNTCPPTYEGNLLAARCATSPYYTQQLPRPLCGVPACLDAAVAAAP